MKKTWYERDDFWEAVGPKIFDSHRWSEAEAEVDHLLDLVELSPGAKVLDVPCGTGRHLIELARRGFRMTGIDLTSAFLRETQERADREELDIELVKLDMRRIDHSDSFDLALNMYTSFGYFVDPRDDLLVLKNIHRSLKPSGRLVIETMSKEVLARIFVERDWREDDDGSLWLEERSIRSGWDWIDVRWIIIDPHGRSREVRFGHRVYSAAELISLLREAGFQGVATHGDLTGSPYDHRAIRLVAVARK